jgi:hypothetical protein
VISLLRAESRKIVATPITWWLLLGTVGIGVVGTLAPLIAAGGPSPLLTDRNLQEAMHGAAAGASLVLVAGIVGMAGEWRFGFRASDDAEATSLASLSITAAISGSHDEQFCRVAAAADHER